MRTFTVTMTIETEIEDEADFERVLRADNAEAARVAAEELRALGVEP